MNGCPAPPSQPDVAAVVAVIQRANGVAVSRSELALRTGLCDRVAREAVAEAVLDGAPIVTERRLGGYCWSADARRIALEVKRLRSHGYRLLKRASALEKYGLPAQEEMFG